MIQEVLVSPTAKLDISKLLKSSPSPSPPPPLSTSRPSISRSYSIPATDPARGAETSPTSSTSSYPTVPSISSSSSQATRQPGFGGQASRLIPTSSSKRTASTSPQESRQANKKPTRQWSKSDSEELLRLRGDNMKWEDVARHFPGRTSTACRLRYQNYLERKYDWTDEKKAKLARLYDRYKHEMWEGISKELQIPWRAVEDMHWVMGQVDMANLAGARLLHPDRVGDDLAPMSPRMQSVFPPGGPSTTRPGFMVTPVSAFAGLPPAPGRMLAQPPQPPTTNATTIPRLRPSGEETGFGFHRQSRRQGSSGGPLPSLAELNLPVSAYATPGGGRYRRESEDEEEGDE
ncbi:MAG: hypothetical protein LQ343_006752 [Gyalolechia ehrenbergii]|nr:MAG: hypothetical protein LQ343_006752 [Gyalolechia ehrenbergii]